jgi:hypothetical protein
LRCISVKRRIVDDEDDDEHDSDSAENDSDEDDDDSSKALLGVSSSSKRNSKQSVASSSSSSSSSRNQKSIRANAVLVLINRQGFLSISLFSYAFLSLITQDASMYVCMYMRKSKYVSAVMHLHHSSTGGIGSHSSFSSADQTVMQCFATFASQV